jgi:hypothetical protein
MPSAYVASTGTFADKASSDHLSPDLVAVIVFSLMGLLVSVALITCMDSDAYSFFVGAF